jgi:predicted MarR family transcription regulator
VRPYRHTRRNGVSIDNHRLLWEQTNGPIPKGSVVHHVNHDKRDNRIENLALMTRQEHSAHHNQIYPLVKTCEVCGIEYTPSPTKRKRSKTCCREHMRVLISRAATERETRHRILRAAMGTT